MKKIITLAVALAAGISFGASSQTATAPSGTDNLAIGYGAGFRSSGSNSDVICLGTDAGMGTTNNSNCIFIGKEAGKGVCAQDDYIDIGGCFKRYNNMAIVGENENSFSLGHAWITGNSEQVTVATNLDFKAGYATFYGMNVFAGSGWNFFKDNTTDYPIFQYNPVSENLAFWAYQEVYKTTYYYENANITFRDSSGDAKLEIQNFPNTSLVDFYAYGDNDIQFATSGGDINFYPSGKLQIESASGMNITLHNKKGAYLLYTEGSNNLEVYVDGVKKGTIQFTREAQ